MSKPKLNRDEAYGPLVAQPCVVCAELLNDDEAEACQIYGVAGACARHLEVVCDEVDKDLPAWPSEWWGHWWLTPVHGWYCNVDDIKRRRWIAANGGE